ncbi:MAG: radical SAM protein [Candidatus Micrarchaeia archaeon]
MLSVLLVQPNYRSQRATGAWSINPPLGLCYIAAVLEKNKIPVKILDANALNLTPEEAVQHTSGFDIVGVSIMTPAYDWAIKFVKLISPSKLKVAGGPHATGWPEGTLKDGFDVVVIGEGEYTMLEIAQGKKLENIQGIAYIDKDIHFNKPRPPLDPNTLPFPARHLLMANGTDVPYVSAATYYRPWAPIFTSRGCPYACYYCNKKVFGQGWRPRSPENVVEEIEQLVKAGVKEIAIYDDCFNMDIKRAEKILDMIIERNIKVYLRLTNGIRVDRVTDSLMSKLKRAGCIYVAFGVESGNQSVLDKIPKGITLDQVRNAVSLAKKYHISCCGFFMFGLLGDTRQTMKETIDFALELDPDMASFNIATPYPGTQMYEIIKREGKLLVNDWNIFHHTSGRMVFTHPDVAKPEEVEAAYRNAIKSFYLRPKYVIRRLTRIRNLTDIKFIWRGLRAIFNSLR